MKLKLKTAFKTLPLFQPLNQFSIALKLLHTIFKISILQFINYFVQCRLLNFCWLSILFRFYARLAPIIFPKQFAYLNFRFLCFVSPFKNCCLFFGYSSLYFLILGFSVFSYIRVQNVAEMTTLKAPAPVPVPATSAIGKCFRRGAQVVEIPSGGALGLVRKVSNPKRGFPPKRGLSSAIWDVYYGIIRSKVPKWKWMALANGRLPDSEMDSDSDMDMRTLCPS